MKINLDKLSGCGALFIVFIIYILSEVIAGIINKLIL